MKKWQWLLGLLALWAPLLAAQLGNEEELLPPEQAFAFQAHAMDATTLRATWQVAEGYYLYRNRIEFETQTPGFTLGTPRFPAGKIKQDEFFGEVETYRHEIHVEIPVTRAAGAPETLTLSARSQGCADIGVCYPPQRQEASVTLLQARGEAGSSGSGALEALSQLGARMGLGGQSDDFLPPEEAFAFSSEVRPDHTLVARWNVAPGYYLYRDKIQFKAADEGLLQLGEPAFPAGVEKDDEFFGRMEIYPGGLLEIPVALQALSTTPLDTTVQVTYQGCAEAGICYPPETIRFPVSLSASPTASTASLTADSPPATGTAPVSEQDRIAQRLAQGNVALIIASFFGFGLLLAFTPCVFPMIPILSSIIVGQGEKITTRRAFILSLVYVLAMAITYTVAGVIAGLFGENLQAAFQNPWILGSFAAVFVLLSFSMFGFYDLQIPQSLQTRLSEFSNRQQGGTLAGVAIMGFLSALIVGPCVAAPLAGALIYIGQSGDPVLGGIALFALSMGMGAPLIMIGTGAGKLLPRAGDWMTTIKAVFGVLLLAVAIWMLERILPATIAMGLWGLLLIVSSIYMGALDSLAPDATGWRRFWKGIGLVLLLYGALLLVGVSAGNGDATRPLQGFLGQGTGQSQVADSHARFVTVKRIEDVQQAVNAAAAQGKGAMLDFYADWCVDCRKLEKYTFSQAGVQQALSNVVWLQADVTANDADDKALLKHFGLIGPPSVLFFSPDGQEQTTYRLVGFLDAADFTDHVMKLPFAAGK